MDSYESMFSRINLYQKGGRFVGQGANGILYSHPRLPYLGEIKYDINNKNQCSKIFYKPYNKGIIIDEDGFYNENTKYINLKNILSNLPLNDYFNLPLSSGPIDQDYVNKNKQYIFNNIWSNNNNIFIYAKNQITFRLGEDVKNDTINDFIKKFKNIIEGGYFIIHVQ